MRCSASGTLSHSSSTRPSSVSCSACARARPACAAACQLLTRAQTVSCAAYQWCACSMTARPGGDQAGIGLERLGEPRVQPGVVAGQQVIEDRLPDQPVPEREPVPVDGEHVGLDRRAQRAGQRVIGQAGDRGQQRVARCAARRRSPP